MKSLLKNLSIFIVLSVLVSGFIGCGGKSNSAVDNANSKVSADNPTADNSQKTDVANGFPPVPAAVANTEIKMLDGKTTKIADQKGSVVLVNLWATWCGPCRGEMPDLIALQDKYRDKNFKILGLDADGIHSEETEPKIKDFAQTMKLNYELGWTDETIMKEFLRISGFSGIPQSFLIDRNGKIRGVFTGGGPKVIGQLKDTVEKVVNES